MLLITPLLFAVFPPVSPFLSPSYTHTQHISGFTVSEWWSRSRSSFPLLNEAYRSLQGQGTRTSGWIYFMIFEEKKQAAWTCLEPIFTLLTISYMAAYPCSWGRNTVSNVSSFLVDIQTWNKHGSWVIRSQVDGSKYRWMHPRCFEDALITQTTFGGSLGHILLAVE